jgi:methionine aminotransferase
MRTGNNQYAPMQGVLLLRERIAEKVYDIHGAQYDPATEITVTSGATEAIFAAISAVVQKDDEVIIFEPAYDVYDPVVRLNGGLPVYVKLKFPDYSVDWNEVKNAINRKTKLVILNYPHNPTGAVLSGQDILNLSKIVKDTDTFIVSDEAYEHIIFDGLQHESLSRYPELAQRSFVISSFGKTYHTTGWKIDLSYHRLEDRLLFSTQTAFNRIAKNSSVPDLCIQHAHPNGLCRIYAEEKAVFRSTGFLSTKTRQIFKFN